MVADVKQSIEKEKKNGGKSHEGPQQSVAMVKYHRKEIRVCVCACAWAYFVLECVCDPHTAECSRKQPARVPGCRSWVIEMRNPCSLRESEISYSRLNADVSQWRRRQ